MTPPKKKRDDDAGRTTHKSLRKPAAPSVELPEGLPIHKFQEIRIDPDLAEQYDRRIEQERREAEAKASQAKENDGAESRWAVEGGEAAARVDPRGLPSTFAPEATVLPVAVAAPRSLRKRLAGPAAAFGAIAVVVLAFLRFGAPGESANRAPPLASALSSSAPSAQASAVAPATAEPAVPAPLAAPISSASSSPRLAPPAPGPPRATPTAKKVPDAAPSATPPPTPPAVAPPAPPATKVDPPALPATKVDPPTAPQPAPTAAPSAQVWGKPAF